MSDKHVEGVVDLVDDIIGRAIAARASDVHFDPGDTATRVRFRVDGLLSDVEELPVAVTPNVVARLKVLGGLLTYRSDVPQEGGIAHGSAGFPCDIRVATFPTVRGERVVLRIMAHAHKFLTLDDLGHDPALIQRLTGCLALPQGLLLVCGPAGSGKTTTLYALLEYVLRHRPGTSVLSVEDPVEIRLDGVTQIEIEPARGLSYAVALRSLLRQDPQVLMIGEVRDAEAAQIIVEASLTGHLVLTTMHSGSAAESIVRLREMGVPAYQITSTLQGVLSQRLLRTLAEPDGSTAGRDAASTSEVRYAGRTAVGHFVEMTPALRQAILDGADVARLGAPELSPGSLREDAGRLLEAGRTTPEEVQRVVGQERW
jgi:type II secretory ATPase GspE/PulE/Tfp pilus assembly ATPase PilB-like protein